MPLPPRYLTKSRFKLATECPTKLFYAGKPEFADQSLDDPFLAALAEGGFQVGALARAMHPDGILIQPRDAVEAVAETLALLERERVTLFEAAFLHGNLFIRVDVLQKQGNVLDLIEVKAKSIGHKSELVGKRSGKIAPEWKPYLLDVAFQEHVLRKVFPEAVIRPRLMLADKNATATVDGLNQRFRLSESGEVRLVGDIAPASLGAPVLTKVNVHDPLKLIKEDHYLLGKKSLGFAGYIDALAHAYEQDEKIPPHVDCAVCGKCSFRASPEEERAGKRSGFKSCWKEAMGFGGADFDLHSVMDLWRCTKKETFRKTGRFFLRDLQEADFDTDHPVQARQWLQVQKTVANDPAPWIDRDGLRASFASWKFPLHFIDFETSAVAIPFTKNRHPYETVAFQFSYHIAHDDGRIEHADEYLNDEPGVFPNFDFVRRLKAALEKDDGTIFRYAAHENTVLNHIKRQLDEDKTGLPDRCELIGWIESVTQDKDAKREGARNMVDLLELVKKHYYQRDMGGSNSIKKVLPALLNHSEYLQEKYGSPAYTSRNFQNHAWVRRDAAGRVKDPYQLLPPVFADRPQAQLERDDAEETLADGGAAMTAYARLQFSDVPESERQAIRQALLRYCELDTLAMAMVWEAWRELLTQHD